MFLLPRQYRDKRQKNSKQKMAFHTQDLGSRNKKQSAGGGGGGKSRTVQQPGGAAAVDKWRKREVSSSSSASQPPNQTTDPSSPSPSPAAAATAAGGTAGCGGGGGGAGTSTAVAKWSGINSGGTASAPVHTGAAVAAEEVGEEDSRSAPAWTPPDGYLNKAEVRQLIGQLSSSGRSGSGGGGGETAQDPGCEKNVGFAAALLMKTDDFCQDRLGMTTHAHRERLTHAKQNKRIDCCVAGGSGRQSFLARPPLARRC